LGGLAPTLPVFLLERAILLPVWRARRTWGVLRPAGYRTTPHEHLIGAMTSYNLTHLKQLEAESIHIIREVAAEFEKPVMLYSIGKDSSVMVRLAEKAFYPGKPPFPLMHVDTTWKFKEMISFREELVLKQLGWDLIVHINQEGVKQGVGPYTHGSKVHTDIMKTEGLKQALNKYQFDAAFGGARRDEEKSRAKERVYSFRSKDHRWDPKNQRPELWNLYNGKVHKGESIRVFPLSNWTELDVWQYIHLEKIPIVPLYFAAERPVVDVDGALIMVDDERMPKEQRDKAMMKRVRFRTLGCYPLTGAVESNATTLPEIIQEMLLTKTSERQGRVIDYDQSGSMEEKKKEGYF
jgi:sulfate adenylyltransferase subunit 2